MSYVHHAVHGHHLLFWLTRKTGLLDLICVDYRKLNKVAKFDAYPMPRIEEVLDSIGSASVISTLDLAKGYWQIPLEEGSKEKSAFTTPYGLYEFEALRSTQCSRESWIRSWKGVTTLQEDI